MKEILELSIGYSFIMATNRNKMAINNITKMVFSFMKENSKCELLFEEKTGATFNH